MNLLTIETKDIFETIRIYFTAHKRQYGNLLTRNILANIRKWLNKSYILKVNQQYLWTSGMAVDCKKSFSWCSNNKKIHFDEINVAPPTDNGQKCLAILFQEGGLGEENAFFSTFNCETELLLFVCEVIKLYFFKEHSAQQCRHLIMCSFCFIIFNNNTQMVLYYLLYYWINSFARWKQHVFFLILIPITVIQVI